jgi:hypothetical protein
MQQCRRAVALRANRQDPALGAFLHGRAAWSHWITCTYADGGVNRGMVQRDLRRWAQSAAKIHGAHVTFAVGIEDQLRGTPHFHALGAFPIGTSVTCRQLERLWWHGHARVVVFDPARGAAWYLAKAPFWGLIVGCPRTPCCRRATGCPFKSEEIELPIY